MCGLIRFFLGTYGHKATVRREYFNEEKVSDGSVLDRGGYAWPKAKTSRQIAKLMKFRDRKTSARGKSINRYRSKK
jgi:hypothetical protein